MTRQEARAAGLTKYFTGKPCKYGHLAERRMSDGCVVCAHRNATEWQKANPEKVKAKGRAYRTSNREAVRERCRAWREANPSKADALTADWRARNAERVKETKAVWRKRHAAEVNETQMRRFAAKRKRTPVWADHASIGMVYRAAEVIRTSGFDVHVDHVVPLQGKTVSGFHVHNNLRVLCAQANRSKSNHFGKEGHHGLSR